MKIKIILIAVIVCMGFILIAQAAIASPNASILYNETDLQNGYWKYDYTFANLSTNNEYLYGIQLYFGDYYDVSDTQSGSAWNMISTASFLGTHSSSYAEDIAAEDALSGFSFTVDNQIGNISYAAFFDDHSGSRSYITGITNSDNRNISPVSVAPEPVSAVLFLIGGATMVFWYKQKRKIQLR